MCEMFCFQCEQTAKGTGCTVSGVCGKKPNVAHEQDVLTCEMIGLAKASDGRSEHVDLIVDGLFVTITNVNFDEGNVAGYTAKIRAAREALNAELPIRTEELFHGDENLVSLRATLLFGLRGMGAYAHHARVLGKRNPEVNAWFIKGMAALAEEHSVDKWLELLMEFGGVNLKCMALLDAANTGAYGDPAFTRHPEHLYRAKHSGIL